jgi:starch synthase
MKSKDPTRLADPSLNAEMTVCILIAGDVIDWWIDPMGVSLEALRSEVDVGWFIGYAEALKSVGIRSILFFSSRHVQAPTVTVHEPTGMTMRIAPARSWFQWLERRLDPPPAGPRIRPGRLAASARWHAGPYFATDLPALATALREEACDGVICQDYEQTRFDLVTALARRLGICSFATFQGATMQQSRFEAPVRRWAMNRCSGLIIPAQVELDRVRSKYQLSTEKLAYIPNPIALNKWSNTDRLGSRSRLGIPDEAFVAICHGRIAIEYKGLDVLLAAWNSVCRERPDQDLRLLLIGSGEDADELHRILTQGEFRGVEWDDRHVTRSAELRDYLAAADIGVFAARYEGYPVALLEAMACGLPMVASRASGVPDMLGSDDNRRGIAVPVNDAAALAKGMGRLIDDSAFRLELGVRARQWVEANCEIGVVGEQLREFMVKRGLRKSRQAAPTMN